MPELDRLGVVRRFIETWNSKDRAAMHKALHRDVEVIGASYPPAHGPDETIALSEPFLAADEIDWQIVNHACNGTLVFVERIDRFRYGDRPWLTLRATGVFDVDDTGLITRWYDYFDSAGLDEAIS